MNLQNSLLYTAGIKLLQYDSIATRWRRSRLNQHKSRASLRKNDPFEYITSLLPQLDVGSRGEILNNNRCCAILADSDGLGHRRRSDRVGVSRLGFERLDSKTKGSLDGWDHLVVNGADCVVYCVSPNVSFRRLGVIIAH